MSEFIADCLDVRGGGMYGRLVDKTGIDRDTTKKRFLAWVYGDSKPNKTGAAAGAIYGGLTDLVAAYKRAAGSGAVLARGLQRLEAEVMLAGAATSLVRDSPDLPFFTVHDAVCARQADIPVVVDAVRRAWRDAFDGVEVPLSEPKPW